MNSKPKIIVLKMREIIYSVLLVLLVILLFFCLFLMFSPGRSEEGGSADGTEQQMTGAGENTTDTDNQTQTGVTEQSVTDQPSAAASSSMVFTPGVYTVPVFLNDATLDVEVTVDADHINAVRLVNLNETVETMYPLMTPALENITSQILQRQTLDGITCPQENRYTSQVLLNAISDALDIARQNGQ